MDLKTGARLLYTYIQWVHKESGTVYSTAPTPLKDILATCIFQRNVFGALRWIFTGPAEMSICNRPFVISAWLTTARYRQQNYTLPVYTAKQDFKIHLLSQMPFHLRIANYSVPLILLCASYNFYGLWYNICSLLLSSLLDSENIRTINLIANICIANNIIYNQYVKDDD